MQKGKHVLIEKPIAVTENEAREVNRVSEETGYQLGICFQNRYNHTSITAKEIIDSGRLRKVLGGGLLINQTIHTLYLMQWLGGDAAYVEASVHTRYLQDVIEVEDTDEALIPTKNDARFVFYATNGNINNTSPLIEIHFENGTMRLENDVQISNRDGSTETIKNPVATIGDKGYWGSGHEILIRLFYRSLIENKKFLLDGRMAAKSLDLVLAFYRSSANNARVVI